MPADPGGPYRHIIIPPAPRLPPREPPPPPPDPWLLPLLAAGMVLAGAVGFLAGIIWTGCP